MTPDQAVAVREQAMIERYLRRCPAIADLVRRGYSARRIAELVGCDPWVAIMIKLSGRW